MSVRKRAGLGSRLLATILASVLVLSLVPAAAGAVTGLPEVLPTTTEWYVDPVAGSDSNGGASWDDAFASISAALEASDAHDVINLAEGTYTGEFPLDIGSYHDGLQFVGAGAGATVLDAESESRVFLVTSALVTFEGMTFENGMEFDIIDAGAGTATVMDAGTGGAVSGISAAMGFTDCEFNYNYARFGGAIAAYDSSLTVSGCDFFGNGYEYGIVEPVAQFSAYCEYGGAIGVEFSEYSIAESTFVENSAEYSGAAVFAALSQGPIDECDFIGNWSGGLLIGGATDIRTQGVDALESAPLLGGIVTVVEGGAGVTGSDFEGNFVMGGPISGYATQLEVADCDFTSNEALVGGVLMIGDPEALYTSDIAAATGVTPQVILLDPSLDVERCVVSDNYGSAVGIASLAARTNITNSLIVHNMDMMAGIYTAEVPYSSIINTTIADNNATFGVADATMVEPNASPSDIVPLPGSLEIYNSIIWDGDEYSVVGASVYASDLSTAVADVPMPLPETAADEDGNISEDPMFVAPAMGDFHLKAGSPCIDTASDFEGAPDDDLDGMSRPVDGDDDTVEDWDMGCYEFFGNTADRVAGDDRYQTAIEISQDHFASAETVVLATGRAFADGLSGSGLAGVYHAPLLLTDPAELSDGVAEEIERLGATHIVITGETDAIAQGVEDELLDLGLETDRIGGANRYETAALIAERIVEEDPNAGGLVFIARGDLFADALTASPVAYANHAPVLLVRPDELPPATIDIIEVLDATKVVVVGGAAAVSDNVASQASELLAAPTDRIDGADRYETSANFSEWAVEGGYAAWNVVGVATGEAFPDALSGGAAIGTQNGTLMLTPRDSVHSAIDDLLSAVGDEIVRLQLFGGVNAVDEATKTQLYSYLP